MWRRVELVGLGRTEVEVAGGVVAVLCQTRRPAAHAVVITVAAYLAHHFLDCLRIMECKGLNIKTTDLPSFKSRTDTFS